MRALAIPIGCLGAVALGVGLGATPVLNENLHWTVWVVVPITGVLLGCAVGWLQFRLAYLMGAPVRTAAAVMLAVCTMVGYAATDVATWATMKVQVVDENGSPSGEMPLHQFVSFSEYMDVRLGSSAISTRPGSSGSPTVEMGRTATTISYAADLLACFAGALALIVLGARATPFCERCVRYKSRTGKHEMALDPELAVEKLEQLHEHVQTGDYATTISFLNDLAKAAPPDGSDLKLVADERVCSGCNEATLMGTVLRRRGKDWKAVDELGFRATSGTGETARLSRVPA